MHLRIGQVADEFGLPTLRGTYERMSSITVESIRRKETKTQQKSARNGL